MFCLNLTPMKRADDASTPSNVVKVCTPVANYLRLRCLLPTTELVIVGRTNKNPDQYLINRNKKSSSLLAKMHAGLGLFCIPVCSAVWDEWVPVVESPNHTVLEQPPRFVKRFRLNDLILMDNLYNFRTQKPGWFHETKVWIFFVYQKPFHQIRKKIEQKVKKGCESRNWKRNLLRN